LSVASRPSALERPASAQLFSAFHKHGSLRQCVFLHVPVRCCSSMPTKASNNQKERVKRPHLKVRSGCKTCRVRRVKCDETKPHCLRCARADRQCEGYEIEYIRLFVSRGCERSRNSSLTNCDEVKINATPSTNPLPSTLQPEITDKLFKHGN